ncbi:MAG TPA: hypothetical protein ENN99_16175 [Chloroflexi bacterium]|nr:hypothetical protein [Chloroflexota bacterium]
MDGYEAEPGALLDAIAGLVIALIFGPWLTVAGLRVMRDLSYVRKKSIVNWVIRKYSTYGAVERGNIYFWAQMVLLVGVGFDLLGVLMLAVIAGILLGW